jgi:transcriptional regulator with XRE-family HTH domain
MWVQQRNYVKVGAVLRAARDAAGLTQAELADKLSKPQSFVSSCEAGQRRVDVLELQRIALALKTDPVRLYSEILASDPGKQKAGRK